MATRLLLLNGVAILNVILFHATGFGYTAMFAWAHRYRPVAAPNYDEVGSAAYYALRLVEQFVVFSIPAFLFVSGFFVSVLAGRAQCVSLQAVGARIRKLLVPYLLWSGLVLAALAIEGRIFGLTRYAVMLATGATHPNFYYVPLLVQLYLVAPLVVLAARANWKALLAGTAALQLAVGAAQYPAVTGAAVPVLSSFGSHVPKWFVAAHLFWFTAGVVAGLRQQELRVLLARGRWILLGVAMTAFVVGVVEWELLLRWSGTPWQETRITVVDGIYSGSLILSFLAFAEFKGVPSRTLTWLGSQSYGIYLAHGLVMGYFARALYHFAPWVLGSQAVLQPLLIGLGLAVPLLLMAAVRRSPSRQLYGYVFG